MVLIRSSGRVPGLRSFSWWVLARSLARSCLKGVASSSSRTSSSSHNSALDAELEDAATYWWDLKVRTITDVSATQPVHERHWQGPRFECVKLYSGCEWKRGEDDFRPDGDEPEPDDVDDVTPV